MRHERIESERTLAKMQTAMKSELAMPTAPIASGPSPPTISVSTTHRHPPKLRHDHRHGQLHIGRNS